MEKKSIKNVSINAVSPKTQVLFNVILGLLGLMSVFPLVFVAIISVTSEYSLQVYGYQLIPKAFSLDAYRFLWAMKDQIFTSLLMSVLVTVLGSLLNVFITTTYAYAISRTEFRYRRFFTIILLITMLFSVSMVPTYLVVTNLLKLRNNLLALILPLALSPFNVLIMRTFFKRSVPNALIEAAKIDGAGDIYIFWKIVLPLAIPGIATITLFAVLAYWNDWFNAMLYIDQDTLMPLQYLLMRIQATIDYFSRNSLPGDAFAYVPKEATQMAMVLISTIPIACTYPFFQKYFVGGLTVGGVKE